MGFLKVSPTVLPTYMLLLVLLTSSFGATISAHKVYAQNSNTGLEKTTNVTLSNGKSIPIKYNISTGKLLSLVLDKDKSTLIGVISAPSDKGNLTLEVPRNVVDAKKQGNADAQFTVHVDGKEATFRETSNNKVTRTLSIDFDKDARVIEIIGTQSTAQ
jgi:hypothetical protein